MDTLATELHHHILDFACTDDGTTARNLCHVSGYFRELARPMLYKTIALDVVEPSKIYQLVDSLTSHSTAVSHSYLTQHLYVDIRKFSRDNSTLVEGLHEGLSELLTVVAPTLKRLAIISTDSDGEGTAFHESIMILLSSFLFPRLHTFTAYGLLNSIIYPHHPHRLHMPSLTHLHVSGFFFTCRSTGADELNTLFSSTPPTNFTHLRVSQDVDGIEASPEGQEEVFQFALASCKRQFGKPAFVFPGSVKYKVLDYDAALWKSPRWRELAKYFNQRNRALAEGKLKGYFILLKRPDGKGPYTIERMKEEWVEGVRAGCRWTEDLHGAGDVEELVGMRRGSCGRGGAVLSCWTTTEDSLMSV